MIFTDGARTQGTTYLEDAPIPYSLSGFGEAIGNAASAQWHDNPIRSLIGMNELSKASSGDETLGSQIERLQGGEDLADVIAKPRPVAEVPLDQARARVKEAGLEQTLKLPDQPNFKAPALDIMMDRARDRREREAAIARGPAGFIPGALTTGTSFLVGAVDPLNIASAFIPVVGELRYAKLMADAGSSAFARAGARAAVGGASGAVGSIPIIGLEALAKTQEAQDFTMADALRQLMFGTVLGGGLHSGGGAVADILRAMSGKPLFPHAPGEPFDASRESGNAPGAPHGAAIEAPVQRQEGAPENAPAPAAASRPAETEAPVPSPIVRALDDLPPRAKEDALRVAIADLAEGRPVSSADMLVAAAKTDPRIAESIEAWHGSPHDFDRFDVSHLGSGEGAQSYGHGLYFAENEAVARDYAEKLAGGKSATGGAGAMTSAGIKLSDLSESHVYRVRIKADREHFLDWDVPLDEQAAGRKLLKDMEPEVREQLEERLEDAGFSGDLGMFTGSELHQLLLKHLRDDYELPGVKPTADGNVKLEAAHYLLGKGIPGFKYLDSGSRPDTKALRKLQLNAEMYRMEHEQELARGGDAKYQRERHEAADRELAEAQAKVENPTRNLVVFDHDIVDITHKNGEPVSRGERAEILHVKQQAGEGGATMIPGPRAARGPRARDPETWSLAEFIAHRGGLDPTDPMIGDVRGSIGTSNKFVPGFGNLIRKGGMRLDHAREAAVEAGYLRDHGADVGGESTTTIRTLLDAIDSEMRGERVYREGREPAARADTAEERHHIEREIHNAFEDAGVDLKAVPDKTQARVLEMMQREGERDPLQAYERAVMEETHYGAETGQHERIPNTIPGWDVPHDAGAAPGAGRAAAPGREARVGETARDAGLGDRQAAANDAAGLSPDRRGGGTTGSPPVGPTRSSGPPAGGNIADWEALAKRPHEYDQPEILEASKAADKREQPASTFGDKRLAAAEKAAADADVMFKDAAAYLPEDLRTSVDDALRILAQEGEDVGAVVRQGAACLAAAVGTAA